MGNCLFLRAQGWRIDRQVRTKLQIPGDMPGGGMVTGRIEPCIKPAIVYARKRQKDKQTSQKKTNKQTNKKRKHLEEVVRFQDRCLSLTRFHGILITLFLTSHRTNNYMDIDRNLIHP